MRKLAQWGAGNNFMLLIRISIKSMDLRVNRRFYDRLAGTTMKEIKLTQGKLALVDDANYEWLNQWNWYYQKGYKTGYAYRNIGTPPHRKHIQMHRLIMQTPPEMEVDHIDLDGLNNQRHNLRNCFHAHNAMNCKRYRNNTSGYKGVYWFKRAHVWVARITFNQKMLFLGYFHNPKEAAKAYDQKAIELFGEYARINGI
jgi:hypothetical protein